MAPRVRPVKCRLPTLMRERGLEPHDVYANPRIDMTKQQFSSYYTGRQKMSLSTTKLFADFFGVPMDDIYTWKYE
ncbi:helix-turn-helix domain-containing protein [Cohnella sp. GCM10012308]|uniref:helix-turn-helix domain-containing protein n=1 Tax=Cohnella sp. GCM10012308 TaxID=3317329 RepID=UPI0036163864